MVVSVHRGELGLAMWAYRFFAIWLAVCAMILFVSISLADPNPCPGHCNHQESWCDDCFGTIQHCFTQNYCDNANQACGPLVETGYPCCGRPNVCLKPRKIIFRKVIPIRYAPWHRHSPRRTKLGSAPQLRTSCLADLGNPSPAGTVQSTTPKLHYSPLYLAWRDAQLERVLQGSVDICW